VLDPVYTTQFARDQKRVLKRGKDVKKLGQVMDALIEEKPLPSRHRDHALSGNYSGRRECHIEPDWLLIYMLSEGEIVFERTGSHADLF